MDALPEEEQEKVLSSLSEVLLGSLSQETLLIPEEMEKARNEGECMAMGGEEGRYVERVMLRRKSKKSCPLTGTKRKRHKRKKKSRKESQGKKEQVEIKEENDSGFGTSSEVLQYTVPATEETQSSDSEDSKTSMESVSLLQAPTHTQIKEDDKAPGMNLAWNVKVFPQLDFDEEGTKTTFEKAVQTVHIPHHANESILQTVNFVSSVIRLKQMVSFNTNISRKEFVKILKRLSESPVEPSEELYDRDEMKLAEGDDMRVKPMKDTVACETIRYVMRGTSAEDVTMKALDVILVWLKEETEKDWKNVCCYWNGSIIADVVDVINKAVDSDVTEIRKKISDFLKGIVDEIHDSDTEDTVQEMKVGFLANFCKSILLQYDLINHVSEKITRFISSGWMDTQDQIATTKKTYFTLRLLQDLLISFLNVLNTNRIEEVFRTRPKHADTGVLNMWKIKWKRDEAVSDNIVDLHSKYLKIIRGWCSQTDAIFNFSVKESPLLSLVAQKCSSLTREILSKLSAVSNSEKTK